MLNKKDLQAELEKEKELLNDLEREAKELKLLLDRAEASKARYSKLVGSMWDQGGAIQKSKNQISLIKQKIKQLDGTRVYMLQHPLWGDCKTYVLEKITPKRIFVQEIGCTRSIQFDRNGDAISGSGKIDMEKTFPEGVK